MKTVSISTLEDLKSAAKYLLGCEMWRTLESGEVLKARIVETEFYHQDDAASHTRNGKTIRNQAMFGPAGHAYVYFTYGMHWCFNVSAGPNDYGAGVLIRAAEPLEGIETMQHLRQAKQQTKQKIPLQQLTNGPAKLAQALAIDKLLYGHDLSKPPLQLFESSKKEFDITQTTRIGISRAKDTIARYYITDNPFVSKP